MVGYVRHKPETIMQDRKRRAYDKPTLVKRDALPIVAAAPIETDLIT